MSRQPKNAPSSRGTAEGLDDKLFEFWGQAIAPAKTPPPALFSDRWDLMVLVWSLPDQRG
ncbi:hypothetical protein ACKFKF_34035 [Phormidesmis sp. 146-12]